MNSAPKRKALKINELLVEVFDDLKEFLALTVKFSEQLITSRDTLTGALGFTKSGLRDACRSLSAKWKTSLSD